MNDCGLALEPMVKSYFAENCDKSAASLCHKLLRVRLPHLQAITYDGGVVALRSGKTRNLSLPEVLATEMYMSFLHVLLQAIGAC